MFVSLLGFFSAHTKLSHWYVDFTITIHIWPMLGTYGHWAVRVFFSVPHLLSHGASIYNGLSEDPWHSQLLPSAWEWSCHYLFLRLRSATFNANALTYCATIVAACAYISTQKMGENDPPPFQMVQREGWKALYGTYLTCQPVHLMVTIKNIHGLRVRSQRF